MPAPEPDDIIVARIARTARHYAAAGLTSQENRAEAVAALRQASRGRTDLLAQHAGICLGFALAEDGAQAERHTLEAALCSEAGADPDLVPVWQQTGYFRACQAILRRKSSGSDTGNELP